MSIGSHGFSVLELRASHMEVFRENSPCGTIEYHYDRSGNLIQEKWDFAGNWFQILAYVYEPDPASE